MAVSRRLVGNVQTQQLVSKSLSYRDLLGAYYEFTKPRIWYLLVFTSLTATFVATRLLATEVSPLKWVIIGAAITLGCAGCNALTSYHDRDIDAVMLRTKHRPLPSGRIQPGSALAFGLVLAGTSLVLSAFINV